ncbi:MAG TPA: hypothetical protein VLG50_04925 [Candidatus Saccharimonadales bacterium]|nr:hypothetical protein [Candidatus Saccharimonadales bacterium]
MELLFVSLPHELQEIIISQRVKLIVLFTKVNHFYHQLLKHQLLDKIGKLPISMGEIQDSILPMRCMMMKNNHHILLQLYYRHQPNFYC